METRRRGGVSRRTFLGAGAAGGAALLAGALPFPASGAGAPAPGVPGEHAPWFEKTIPELRALMDSGRLTSAELTLGYLHRIAHLNPLLHAVIETNPAALMIAGERDAERRARRVRGPLHGIPVLLKDNIATRDGMQTTAGSLALVGSRVPADARLVSQLREAGAVILGKANLSEWANFRGYNSVSGWSARGGFTMDPYLLDYNPSGSSSGSAAAAAANLCAAAVGTETDGSIISPSGNNLIVGLKPTVGLVAQSGIIPIAHSQDTAGPMARTVTDVAVMLGVLQSPFGEVARHHSRLPDDYTKFLKRNALRGARIGLDPAFVDGPFGPTGPDGAIDQAMVDLFNHACDVMTQAGATMVPTSIGDVSAYALWEELLVLLYEIKADMAAYLSGLRHTDMRTLGDLIAFNLAHCDEEMKYFGQELFEWADSMGDLDSQEYIDARKKCLELSRGGIDGALKRDRLDAVAAPHWSWISSPPAVAGYPDLEVPIGLTPDGRPVGLCLVGSFLWEPQLLALGYALEQRLQARTPPKFVGEPAVYPEQGPCATTPAPTILRSATVMTGGLPAGPRRF